jgi:hypothetical protein
MADDALLQKFKIIQSQTGQSFRLNCSKLLLTYEDCLDREAYRRFILDKPSCRHARIWLAYEGDVRTHILFDFGSQRFETRQVEFFDFGLKAPHPIIRTIDGRNKKTWQLAILYLIKVDPGNVDLIQELSVGSKPVSVVDAGDTKLKPACIIVWMSENEKTCSTVRLVSVASVK